MMRKTTRRLNLRPVSKAVISGVISLAAGHSLAASVCVDDGRLVFQDDKITGSGGVWVAGYNNGHWMWESHNSCQAGSCASPIVYSGGLVEFRLEGSGIDGYYSPAVFGVMNSPVVPGACSGTPTPTPPPTPTPIPTPTPTPTPTPMPGNISVDANGVVHAHIGERFRVRHELSFSDFNNYNIQYWFARYGWTQLTDYTRAEAASLRQTACGTTEPCVVVTFAMPEGVATQDDRGGPKDCNQASPDLRYFKEYGSETGFRVSQSMDILNPDGSVVDECGVGEAQRAAATAWRHVMKPDVNAGRPFARGDQIEFEVTMSFSSSQALGDNVNYYGQTFRYVLGEGFVVNNQDPAVGPVGVNDSFAKLGGDTTIPHLADTGGAQRRLSFMQHAYNMSVDNIKPWLDGRRLFHTSFIDGSHIEELLPGPQVNVLGQPPLTEVSGFATNPIQASCTQCHTNNGNGALQQGQDVVPPKLIGLGLLGAIEDSQIEQWAAGNGGRVSRVTVNGQQQIGRFGWRAQTVSLRHQIAKALHDDFGVGSPFEGFGPAEVSNAQLDDLVNYSKLIAVPVPRDNLTAMPGHQLFQDFGCNSCHKMTVTTGVDNGFPEVSNQVIHPYTDLLLHDLGEGEYRTAPLWGIGLSGYVRDGNAATFNLMHDGASLTLDAAIQRHNGDATAAKSAYNASTARQQLIDYLMAL